MYRLSYRHIFVDTADMELLKDEVYELTEFYNWSMSIADDRVKDWFLMDAYTPTLVITGIYLLAVWIGPKLMEKREPYQLKTLLVLYNAVLVVINFYIFSELLTATWKLNYSYSCQTINYTDDPDEVRVAKALWWFYFSKLIELLDTVFFVLRKKNNQISFLHVYHHSTMFVIYWICVKWAAGGQTFFAAMLNSFIHVLMYSYYGLSAMGPDIQKHLWWKRYLTRIQLIQFVVVLVHAVRSLWIRCDFPEWLQWLSVHYPVIIFVLFLNFYFHAYVKRQQIKAKIEKSESDKQKNNGHIPINGGIDPRKSK